MRQSLGVLRWREFRAMALYRKAIVVLMLGHAAAMGALTGLLALSGQTVAVATLSIAVLALAFGLVLYPMAVGATRDTT